MLLDMLYRSQGVRTFVPIHTWETVAVRHSRRRVLYQICCCFARGLRCTRHDSRRKSRRRWTTRIDDRYISLTDHDGPWLISFTIEKIVNRHLSIREGVRCASKLEVYGHRKRPRVYTLRAPEHISRFFDIERSPCSERPDSHSPPIWHINLAAAGRIAHSIRAMPPPGVLGHGSVSDPRIVNRLKARVHETSSPIPNQESFVPSPGIRSKRPRSVSPRERSNKLHRRRHNEGGLTPRSPSITNSRTSSIASIPNAPPSRKDENARDRPSRQLQIEMSDAANNLAIRPAGTPYAQSTELNGAYDGTPSFQAKLQSSIVDPDGNDEELTPLEALLVNYSHHSSVISLNMLRSEQATERLKQAAEEFRASEIHFEQFPVIEEQKTRAKKVALHELQQSQYTMTKHRAALRHLAKQMSALIGAQSNAKAEDQCTDHVSRDDFMALQERYDGMLVGKADEQKVNDRLTENKSGLDNSTAQVKATQLNLKKVQQDVSKLEGSYTKSQGEVENLTKTIAEIKYTVSSLQTSIEGMSENREENQLQQTKYAETTKDELRIIRRNDFKLDTKVSSLALEVEELKQSSAAEVFDCKEQVRSLVGQFASLRETAHGVKPITKDIATIYPKNEGTRRPSVDSFHSDVSSPLTRNHSDKLQQETVTEFRIEGISNTTRTNDHVASHDRTTLDTLSQDVRDLKLWLRAVLGERDHIAHESPQTSVLDMLKGASDRLSSFNARLLSVEEDLQLHAEQLQQMPDDQERRDVIILDILKDVISVATFDNFKIEVNALVDSLVGTLRGNMQKAVEEVVKKNTDDNQNLGRELAGLQTSLQVSSSKTATIEEVKQIQQKFVDFETRLTVLAEAKSQSAAIPSGMTPQQNTVKPSADRDVTMAAGSRAERFTVSPDVLNHLQYLTHELEGAKIMISSLERRYNELTTEPLVQAMANQMTIMYPDARNCQATVISFRTQLQNMQVAIENLPGSILSSVKLSLDRLNQRLSEVADRVANHDSALKDGANQVADMISRTTSFQTVLQTNSDAINTIEANVSRVNEAIKAIAEPFGKFNTRLEEVELELEVLREGPEKINE
nr:hypothetical protein CFP56_13021 [Quercus suber]